MRFILFSFELNVIYCYVDDTNGICLTLLYYTKSQRKRNFSEKYKENNLCKFNYIMVFHLQKLNINYFVDENKL